MALYLWIITIIIYFGFCIGMIFWMQHTFKYKYSLNYFIFRFELEKKKKSIMHWVEIIATIILFIAFFTTITSQIQIWLKENKNDNQ